MFYLFSTFAHHAIMGVRDDQLSVFKEVMPLHLSRNFPAIERLKQKSILAECGEEKIAYGQVKPIKVAVLSLMPTRLQTETDILRLLSASPLDTEVVWMRLRSHMLAHVPATHMDAYYHYSDELVPLSFDGLVVTGTPVEHLDFEEADYWDELMQIFSWARTSLKSILYICWAAQAGLYFHEGIHKYVLPKKMFGIFPQRVLHPKVLILRRFDDVFRMPHSRHTEIRKEDTPQHPELTLLTESEECGVSVYMTTGGKEIFITGHMEYAPDTLDQEYHRDVGKRDDVDLLRHYYHDGNPAKGLLATRRAHAHLLFINWMNEYLR